MPPPLVCVSIVTCNSGRYIGRCLDAVLGQKGVHLEIVVVDNASTDDTCNLLAKFHRRIRLIRNQGNLGFAAAQNQAVRLSSAPWVLALNPDVLLSPGFLQHLLEGAELDPRAGVFCGKLLSIAPGFAPLPKPAIDSTGIYFTPAMRHFDRGYHEPDEGRYEAPEYVFGATAAAALYRREMIEDISLEGDFFDPDFFTYREDADVAWRAQLRGWRCIYVPAAVAHHVRSVSAVNRKSTPPVLNMHSVKNRFLMRVNNLTPGIWRRYWLPMLWRDLLVVGGCLLVEPSSLPALWNFARCLPRARRRRRLIMSRRTVTDDVLAQWFSFRPVAYPIGSATPVVLPRAIRAAASSASALAP